MKNNALLIAVAVSLAAAGILTLIISEPYITGGATQQISVSMRIVVPCYLPSGDSVAYEDCNSEGVDVAFGSIITAGYLTIEKESSNPTGVTPSGFKADGIYFSISTDAEYTPPVSICMTLDEVNEDQKMFHYEIINFAYEWVDVTTSVNTATSTICGEVNSLSYFGVFNKSAPAPSGGSSGGGGGGSKTIYTPTVIYEEPEEEFTIPEGWYPADQNHYEPAPAPEKKEMVPVLEILKMNASEMPGRYKLYLIVNIVGFISILAIIILVLIKIFHKREY